MQHEKSPKTDNERERLYWLYFVIIPLTLRGLLEINLNQIKEERKTLHDSLVKKVREKDRLQRRLKNMLLQHKMSKDALHHTQELYNKTNTQVCLHCYFYTYESVVTQFMNFYKQPTCLSTTKSTLGFSALRRSHRLPETVSLVVKWSCFKNLKTKALSNDITITGI